MSLREVLVVFERSKAWSHLDAKSIQSGNEHAFNGEYITVPTMSYSYQDHLKDFSLA